MSSNKRPFVEAFSDPASEPLIRINQNNNHRSIEESFYFTHAQDEGYTLDWVKENSSKIVAGTASIVASGVKFVLQQVQDFWAAELQHTETSSPKRLKSEKENGELVAVKPPEQYFLENRDPKPASSPVRHNPMGLNWSSQNTDDPGPSLDKTAKKKKSVTNLLRAATFNRQTNHNETPKPVKSSGGLFTPVSHNNSGIPMDLDTPSASQNSSTRTFTPLVRKGKIDFSPEVTPSYKQVESSVIPEMTYGTSFLFKNQAKGTVSSNPNKSNWVVALRDSVQGTYKPHTPRSDSDIVEVTYGNWASPQARTPFGKLSRPRTGSIYQDIQKDRERLERRKEQEARQKSQQWNEDQFPSSLNEIQKRQLYDEIVKRHLQVKKGVEELRAKKEALRPKDKPFVALSPELERQAEKYWRQPSSTQTVVSGYRIDISIRDIQTLRDREWLNDNIIDYYLSMISEREQGKSFCFSTHFFTTLQGSKGYQGVARWAKKKKVDVTQLNYVFVPINRSNTHWCLAVINNKEKKFQFFDSMGGYGTPALELLRQYMISESDRMYPGKIDEFKAKYQAYEICDKLDCPQQSNGSDCGVFTCKMVEVLSREKDFAFDQKDMRSIRRKMVHEIIQKSIINP